MEPGGTLGEHIKEHEKMGIAGSLRIHLNADGTFINFSVGGTVRWRIRVADGQFQIPAGIDANTVM